MKNINCDENFEVESKLIECGLKPTMNFNDLSDTEKSEIFGFTMDNALEMTR